MAKRRQSVSVEEEDAFRHVIDEIMEEVVWHPTMSDTGLEGWLLKMVDYNVPLGKQLRGRGVISAYKSFAGVVTKEELKPIYVLGWCVELLAASLYIAEDIMRRSITRRGQLCWHLVEDVGKSAITDAFLLQNVMYFAIDKHLRGQPSHKHIVELFHRCFFNTSLGQNLDFRVAQPGNFDGFTVENYERVAKYKAGYFTFYLPMAIGKIMADGGLPDEKEMKLVEDIAVAMGELYLVQDDYIDCFVNLGTSSRCATKIQGNFCTWFVIQALAIATPEEEKILKENYGKKGTENTHRIIKLFQNMNLVEEYKKYEMKCYHSIMQKIALLPESIPALYFSESLDIIMKREK